MIINDLLYLEQIRENKAPIGAGGYSKDDYSDKCDWGKDEKDYCEYDSKDYGKSDGKDYSKDYSKYAKYYDWGKSWVWGKLSKHYGC